MYRDSDHSTPLHLLNEDEILDLLDKDHLLPRTNNPELEEVIIKVSACLSVSLSVCQFVNLEYGDQF